MAGIVFLKTKNLEEVKSFYSKIGAKVWIDQTDCIIFKHDNFLFGFCERDGISTGWLLTFFYETRVEVDRMYEILNLGNKNISPPVMNEKYNIYHFFTTDPEGRDIEFQVFLDKIDFNWNEEQ